MGRELIALLQCSGLMNNLLTHSYGYSKENLKTWFGHLRPLAHPLSRDVSDPQRKRTARILQLKDAQPGDLLVVKYSEFRLINRPATSCCG